MSKPELKLKTITAKLRDEVRAVKFLYMEKIAELQQSEKALKEDDLKARAEIGFAVELENDKLTLAIANLVIDTKEKFTEESDIEQLETAIARFR